MALDDGIVLETGRSLVITNDETVVGTPERIGTTYEPLPRDVRTGDTILLDDGNLELRVIGTTAHDVNCEIVHGGVLKSNKGMNLPGVSLSIPALTEKDRTDLAFGLSLGVDFVALSFVRRAEDLREARELIRSLGGDAPLIAKIEKREAIDNLASILEEADGVMVARGDLGVELSTEEVPTLQKRIIAMANAAGKPVITATQMLESMIDRARPTRAEASDVANAILDGTDAVMLSAETASGHFPVESVETMARIAHYTEENDEFQSPGAARRDLGVGGGPGARPRGLHGGLRASSALDRGVHGDRIHRATRLRLPAPGADCRDHAIGKGPPPAGSSVGRHSHSPSVDERYRRSAAIGRSRRCGRAGHVKAGDRIVILAGQSHTAGATNLLKVHTVR